MYKNIFKPLFDFILSLTAIIVLSPILLLLIVIGMICMKGWPFFCQERVGKAGRAFNLLKFRTMNNAKDKDGHLLPDEQRINKYGRFLRLTSLDELPELFNILKGDMSIVGPRPLLVSYLPYYTEREKHRHDMKPGLTGLAQVRGRSFLTWEEIFEYDLEYVSNCCITQDVSIIFQTIGKVFQHEEIADVQTISVDKDGTTWVIDNGKKKKLHRPLNEERDTNAERNRE